MGNEGPAVNAERRGAPRYRIEAPVDLGDSVGNLVNLSTADVLIRTNRRLVVGDRFRFCWTVGSESSGQERVCCQVRVVHLEPENAGSRVAATIESVSSNPIDSIELPTCTDPKL